MTSISVTQIAFGSASLLSLILTFVFLYQALIKSLPRTFIFAAAAQTIWLMATAYIGTGNHEYLSIMLWAESLHFCSWIISITIATYHYNKQRFPRIYIIFISLSCIIPLAICIATAVNFSSSSRLQTILILQNIFLAIVALLVAEQFFRSTRSTRFVKLLCLNVGLMFFFDVYAFSQNLIIGFLDENVWQIRAAITMAACIIITVSAMSMTHKTLVASKIKISRPIAFYSTSLTIAGILLTVLAFGGYYVRLYGGQWGSVIYIFFLVSSITFIIFVFSSKRVRENINVLIGKHLFRYKYDYRSEWLNLINKLSQPMTSSDAYENAIQAVADLFKSPGGALWCRHDSIYVPTKQINLNVLLNETIETTDSKFCQFLSQNEWVFSPSNSSEKKVLKDYNHLLPDWAINIPDLWLLLPLMSENNLLGFMILTEPAHDTELTWEDLDLLKTVGRQVGSYLERHEQAERLAESKQFNAFNKMSAFLMHDLKNLIAQQSLVVKNAEKHKDNPAFINDTISTVNNSVVRMSNLLKKLQFNEPDEARTLNLREVLVNSVQLCQQAKPSPTLGKIPDNLFVIADMESLMMVFTNIVHNAQDATSADGYIDISLIVSENSASIYIEDDGPGMDQTFIDNRLFKPFETTKQGKGMGIGVFQSKEYVNSLGGNISVQSEIGHGATFVISLPLINKTTIATKDDSTTHLEQSDLNLGTEKIEQNIIQTQGNIFDT